MERYKSIDNKLFIKNRKKIIDLLPDNSFAIVSSNNQYSRNGDVIHKYRQNSDFFYLTGIEQEDSILIISKKGTETLFIIEPNKKMETWLGKKLTNSQATSISGITSIKFIDKFEDSLLKNIKQNKSVFLNLDLDLNYEIPTKDSLILNKYNTNFADIDKQSLIPMLTKLRAVKEQAEIQLMGKAIEITKNAFLNILQSVGNGTKEYEIEAEMIYEFTKNAATHSFHPIVASGINACTLHYETNSNTCKNGDLVLLDFGAEYSNYAADVSRTIPISGKFSERQKECYSAVLEIQKDAIALIKPGTTVNKINAAVVEMFEKKMIQLGLFTKNDLINQSKDSPLYFNFYMHGASHFLGLDVHDLGFREKDTILTPGMIVTCEPGIYIQKESLGIRIEDDILITKDGNINLTKDIPKEIYEIEELMKTN